MLDFNRAFKETQDVFGIRGDVLAKQLNRSTTTLSKIRTGKSFPSVSEFSEMIETADTFHPGFKEEFLRRLNAPHTNLSPRELVDSLSGTQLAELMTAIGDRVARSISNSSSHQQAA